MAASIYEELAAPPHLSDVVLCLWRETVLSEAPGSLTVLPDGAVDIVWPDHGRPFVAGPMTRSSQPDLPPNTHLFGLRLRPGAAHRLLGVDMNELSDQTVELREIWPAREHDRWQTVAERPADEQPSAVASLVVSRLGAEEGRDSTVSRATAWLAEHPNDRIEALSDVTGLSSRQLQRRFVQEVGYGAKLLQRVLRLQLCLWLAGRLDSHDTLASLAAGAGYADQSHMTREVQALTQQTPAALFLGSAAASTVSEMFNTLPGEGENLRSK